MKRSLSTALFRRIWVARTGSVITTACTAQSTTHLMSSMLRMRHLSLTVSWGSEPQGLKRVSLVPGTSSRTLCACFSYHSITTCIEPLKLTKIRQCVSFHKVSESEMGSGVSCEEGSHERSAGAA